MKTVKEYEDRIRELLQLSKGAGNNMEVQEKIQKELKQTFELLADVIAFDPDKNNLKN